MKDETSYICDPAQNEMCLCPLEGIINTISKKWTLQIIAQIGNHRKLRYTEIKKRLGGISPKSLADRLKELEREGLINRKAFAEIPPRVEYMLTDDGETLRRSMMPLMEWASTRTFEGAST